MSDSLFDYCLLPFASFAPSNTLFTPPAQRWLDAFSHASQTLSEAVANPAGLQGTLYRQLLAGQPDPFKSMAGYADAPAWPLDWIDTCSRASAIMSKAHANAVQRQLELGQSWAAAQQQLAPVTDGRGLHERIESLHDQTTQAVAQLRNMADEYLKTWFAAAEIIADAWPAAPHGHGEHAVPAAARPDDDGQAKPGTSRAAARRR